MLTAGLPIPGRPHRTGFPTTGHVGTRVRRGIINSGFQIFISLFPPCNIKKKKILSFFLKGKINTFQQQGLRKTALLYFPILRNGIFQSYDLTATFITLRSQLGKRREAVAWER